MDAKQESLFGLLDILPTIKYHNLMNKTLEMLIVNLRKNSEMGDAQSDQMIPFFENQRGNTEILCHTCNKPFDPEWIIELTSGGNESSGMHEDDLDNVPSPLCEDCLCKECNQAGADDGPYGRIY
jgi:hypothetical protein